MAGQWAVAQPREEKDRRVLIFQPLSTPRPLTFLLHLSLIL